MSHLLAYVHYYLYDVASKATHVCDLLYIFAQCRTMVNADLIY